MDFAFLNDLIVPEMFHVRVDCSAYVIIKRPVADRPQQPAALYCTLSFLDIRGYNASELAENSLVTGTPCDLSGLDDVSVRRYILCPAQNSILDRAKWSTT